MVGNNNAPDPADGHDESVVSGWEHAMNEVIENEYLESVALETSASQAIAEAFGGPTVGPRDPDGILPSIIQSATVDSTPLIQLESLDSGLSGKKGSEHQQEDEESVGSGDGNPTSWLDVAASSSSKGSQGSYADQVPALSGSGSAADPFDVSWLSESKSQKFTVKPIIDPSVMPTEASVAPTVQSPSVFEAVEDHFPPLEPVPTDEVRSNQNSTHGANESSFHTKDSGNLDDILEGTWSKSHISSTKQLEGVDEILGPAKSKGSRSGKSSTNMTSIQKTGSNGSVDEILGPKRAAARREESLDDVLGPVGDNSVVQSSTMSGRSGTRAERSVLSVSSVSAGFHSVRSHEEQSLTASTTQRPTPLEIPPTSPDNRSRAALSPASQASDEAFGRIVASLDHHQRAQTRPENGPGQMARRQFIGPNHPHVSQSSTFGSSSSFQTSPSQTPVSGVSDQGSSWSESKMDNFSPESYTQRGSASPDATSFSRGSYSQDETTLSRNMSLSQETSSYSRRHRGRSSRVPSQDSSSFSPRNEDQSTVLSCQESSSFSPRHGDQSTLALSQASSSFSPRHGDQSTLASSFSPRRGGRSPRSVDSQSDDSSYSEDGSSFSRDYTRSRSQDDTYLSNSETMTTYTRGEDDTFGPSIVSGYTEHTQTTRTYTDHRRGDAMSPGGESAMTGFFTAHTEKSEQTNMTHSSRRAETTPSERLQDTCEDDESKKTPQLSPSKSPQISPKKSPQAASPQKSPTQMLPTRSPQHSPQKSVQSAAWEGSQKSPQASPDKSSKLSPQQSSQMSPQKSVREETQPEIPPHKSYSGSPLPVPQSSPQRSPQKSPIHQATSAPVAASMSRSPSAASTSSARQSEIASGKMGITSPVVGDLDIEQETSKNAQTNGDKLPPDYWSPTEARPNAQPIDTNVVGGFARSPVIATPTTPAAEFLAAMGPPPPPPPPPPSMRLAPPEPPATSNDTPLWEVATQESEHQERKSPRRMETPRKSQLAQSLMARTRSRADPSAVLSASGTGSSSMQVERPNMVRIGDQQDERFIVNTALARKRVSVVQLLGVGLLGLLVALLGSFWVQSSCHFVTARVTVGANEQIFKLHYGLWKYTPIESAFQGYTYCYKYDDDYTADSPVFSRVATCVAMLGGMFSLSVLWFYLIFGRGTRMFWDNAVKVAFISGGLQLSTLLIFFGPVCRRDACSIGPAGFLSACASIVYFILAFEMHYNSPIQSWMDDIPSCPSSEYPHRMMQTLELSDVRKSAAAYVRRLISSSPSVEIPSLNQFRRNQNEEPIGEAMFERDPVKVYRPPAIV